MSDQVEQDVLRAFSVRGALTPHTAMTAHELGIAEVAALESLIERGILRRVSQDPARLYMPLLARAPNTPRVLLTAITVFVVAVLLVAIVMVTLLRG